MKPLILLILSASFVSGQTSEPPVKLKNWRERVYRGYKVDDLNAARKRSAWAEDLLNRYRTTPNFSFPELIKPQEELATKYQKELEAAESELAKVDQMLSDPATRKAFNKELDSLMAQRHKEYSDKHPATSPYYPSTRNFRVDCYSGGYGRHTWVRCTSTWY